MKISNKMRDFAAFMAEIYSTERLDFSKTKDLKDAENIIKQMKDFVNSADFLNECTAIFNRSLREIQCEIAKRKGL